MSGPLWSALEQALSVSQGSVCTGEGRCVARAHSAGPPNRCSLPAEARPSNTDRSGGPTDPGSKPQAHQGRAEMSSGWRVMRSAVELQGKAPTRRPS
ncbi:hypothetical protein NDU88_003132 [Pleurodeles waltl]|uniref:Uncharacterized protein n=1 Tax=Pleurodeles waltl TaxID=8319 RepID=A0AAV7KU12_PLEWA|nr:hypothetical protein NDU88_003132 [Pleurodeles waltl]